jgi:hypothetical protein
MLMRVLGVKVLGAVAMIACLALPAYAQAPALSLGTPDGPPKSQQDKDAEAARDKAYKESLKKIPDAKAADPWGIARSVDTPKSSDKSGDKTSAPAKPRTKTGSTAN